MQATDSLIVGGRPLDAAYGPHNSSVPAGAYPGPESRFSSFRLESEPNDLRRPVVLGAGALFGPVVRAHLEGDNQPVAVKTFLSLKEDYTRQALETYATHEYRRGAADLGPHFVRARSLIESLDRDSLPVFLLVMDLIQGQTLESLIGKSVPMEQQRDWVEDALRALQIMADRGLIQQDVKPANIMTSEHGLVFIDHGSSRALDQRTHTNDQSTYAFLAPEYWSTSTFTLETMIFGIGLTLLEVITGGQPYLEPAYNRATADPNSGEYLRRTQAGTLNLAHPSLDPRAAQVIATMTAQDPQQRKGVLSLGTSHKAETRHSAQPADRVPVDLDDEDFEPVSSVNVPRSVKSEVKQTDSPFALEMPHRNPAPRNLLIDFAGVDSTAVYDNERRHYSAIGVALIVYLVYIFLGAFALAHQVSNDWTTAVWAAAIVGPLLGAALVNFDRSIVNSIRPNLKNLRDPDEPPLLKGGWGYTINIIVRVLATILIAFLIGSAVDVELHRRDVLPVVAEEQQAMQKALDHDVTTTYGARRTKAKERVSAAIKAQKDAAGLGAKLRKAAEKESAGKGATRRSGCGPRCQQLLNDATRADKDYSRHSGALQKSVDKANAESEALEAEISTFMKPQLQRIADATGPIAQARALWTLSLRDTYTMMTNIGLIAVFMVIELFAVAMKLATSGNSYERTQGARARLRALIEQETTETQQADIVVKARANRQLQEDTLAVEVLRRTLDLEAAAKALYEDGSRTSKSAGAGHRADHHPHNGASPRTSLAPTLVMLTETES